MWADGRREDAKGVRPWYMVPCHWVQEGAVCTLCGATLWIMPHSSLCTAAQSLRCSCAHNKGEERE